MLVASAALCAAGARAAHAQEITLAIGSWCPYVCAQGDAPGLDGFVAEIARAALEPHGARVAFVVAPYERAIALVRANRANGIVAVTREDAPELVFPGIEQGFTVNRFFVRAGDPWRYRGLESFL